MNASDWDELLEQVEYLEYVSPDIEQQIAAHRRHEADQELELTGKEFLESPAIPTMIFLPRILSSPRPLVPRLRSQQAAPPAPHRTYLPILFELQASSMVSELLVVCGLCLQVWFLCARGCVSAYLDQAMLLKQFTWTCISLAGLVLDTKLDRASSKNIKMISGIHQISMVISPVDMAMHSRTTRPSHTHKNQARKT